MRSARSIILLTSCLLAMGCSKKKFFDGPDTFMEDFEGYSIAEDLFSGSQDSLWSFYQLTMEGNQFNLSTAQRVSGNTSMLFYAEQWEDGVSKCSIAKQNMAFWDGETMEVSAMYYLEGTAPNDWMFIMDLEEQTAVGAGPGTRIAFTENDVLGIEHKYNEPNYLQDPNNVVKFPRDQWVEVKVQVHLSKRKKGWIKLYQDGVLIVERSNVQTLPKDLLYFIQGSKGVYSSCEFGITANSRLATHTLYVDDINIRVLQ